MATEIFQLATSEPNPIPPTIRMLLPSTSSAMATEIFKQKFLVKAEVMGNTSPEIDEIEQSAYYGGVVQVFNHALLKDVKYIDVNSLYPAAMTMVRISYSPADGVRPFLYKLGDKKRDLNKWALYLVNSFRMRPDTIGMLPVRTE